MIRVTRFDGTEYYINAEFIESIEATPDTVISLTTNKRIVVRESVEEILQRVVAFKRSIFRNQLQIEDHPVEQPRQRFESFDWIEKDVMEEEQEDDES